MNIAHTQQIIADLNKAYIGGHLGYEEYRNKRALTFESIFDEITVRDIKIEVKDTAPHRVVIKDTSNIYIYLAIIVLLICLGLAVAFLFSSNVFTTASKTEVPTIVFKENNMQKKAVNSKNILQETIIKNNQTSAGDDYHRKNETIEELVAEGFKNNKWNANKLKDIERLWMQATLDERNVYRQAMWFSKLMDALSSLLLEQKALIDLGNKDAGVFEKNITQLMYKLKAENN